MLQPVVAPDIGHTDALGHGVYLIQALGRNDLQPLELQIPGADASGVGHGLQTGQILFVKVRQLDDALHQRGHHLHIFDLIFLNEPDNVGRVKGRGHHQGVAAVQAVERGGVGRPVKQRPGQKLALFKGHTGVPEPAVQTRPTFACGGILLDDLGLSRRAAGAVGQVGYSQNIGRQRLRIALTERFELGGAQALVALGLLPVGHNQRGSNTAADLRHVALGHPAGNGNIAAAGLPDTKGKSNVGGDVGQGGDHTFARLYPLLDQIPCDAVGKHFKLPPCGHALLVFRGDVDEGRLVRLYPGDILKLLSRSEKSVILGIEKIKMLSRAHGRLL